MRIAVFIRNMENGGGSEESMRTLKRHLEDKHEVKLFGSVGENSERMISYRLPLPRQMKILGGYLEGLRMNKKLERFEPDLILTQHDLSFLAARYSDSKDADTILFLRDYETLYRNRFYGRYKIDAVVNYFFSFLTEVITSITIGKSDKIISNSEYLGEKYEEYFDIQTNTVYPFVDLENYRVKKNGEKILHVNPKKDKGIDITLGVAEEMPEQEFIIAGTTKRESVKKRIESLDNVEHLGYVDDMKKVYRQTKIVLMPSLWEEPYGRIPIEAGASGIPTIATENGGLPESVGNEELLVDSEKPGEFVEKINEVEEKYEKFSEQATQNAEKKSKEKQLQKFEELMQDVR